VLSLPGPIVSAAWLREHAAHPDLRIVDVRWSLGGPAGRELYAAGHIPGAIFVDLDRDLSAPRGSGPGRHPLPDPAHLAGILSARGIGDGHAVVAYDDAGGSVASRLWWLFEHFGHAGSAAVLDGGISAWTDAGGALSASPPEHPRATWTPGGPRRDDVVDAAEVERRRDDGATILLDVRAAERYRGEVEPVDPRAGHIPGAVSAPTSGNLDPEGHFLPPGALRARYLALGAGDRQVIAYCGSGVTATQAILAMRTAGIDAQLYEGSWSDWSSDPALPGSTGPRPEGATT
jgi:thiosulfate/3-mercaptopyruvate sulfurtransferase